MIPIKCPFCSNSETKVLESRESEDNINRRRRECEKCSKRFTTYERIELPSLLVIKKDGNREEFDREKVKRGILHACEKRPIAHEAIDKLASDIETEIRQKHEDDHEVKSSEIGAVVMRKLKTLDEVAYIRFASVYKRFTDVESFKKEIDKLL